ncbi:hypothetical protein ACET3Z_011492 [Daucus carota]
MKLCSPCLCFIFCVRSKYANETSPRTAIVLSSVATSPIAKNSPRLRSVQPSDSWLWDSLASSSSSSLFLLTTSLSALLEFCRGWMQHHTATLEGLAT